MAADRDRDDHDRRDVDDSHSGHAAAVGSSISGHAAAISSSHSGHKAAAAQRAASAAAVRGMAAASAAAAGRPAFGTGPRVPVTDPVPILPHLYRGADDSGPSGRYMNHPFEAGPLGSDCSWGLKKFLIQVVIKHFQNR